MAKRSKQTQRDNDTRSQNRARAARRDRKESRDRTEERDEKNKAKFVAPPGVVAQDLPDAKHGMNVVDSPKEMRRNLPQQHGGLAGEHEEGGMRGDRNIGEAAHYGQSESR